jgi:uncharacterized SAM-binding protein YcdF (DUF218 family)
LALIIFFFWPRAKGTPGPQHNIKKAIEQALTTVDPIPSETKADAIYILGGGQESLEEKFKTAVNLYKREICNKILIAHRSGTTEYSPELNRNLTNNEWSIRQLKKLSIPRQDIEIIKLEEGFFGTLSEAKGISSLARERNYKNIILISSPEHTRRVKISFEHFLQNASTKIYTLGSEQQPSLMETITELIKLNIYKYFLL